MDLSSITPLAALLIGLVFGLKHATEVDHIVAVSTIVSEERNLFRSAMVGAVWGVGHTAALLLVGLFAIALRITVPLQVGRWLEFCVALMIIGLGVSAFLKAIRRRRDFHLHRHTHDGVSHVHLHFHDEKTSHGRQPAVHNHGVSSVGLKPLVVGAMHGLAGSAALTLLVITQIESAAFGVLYLAMFGAGSILGMLAMSALIGVPFALTAKRASAIHHTVQTVAGALSIIVGIWYALETVNASELLKGVV